MEDYKITNKANSKSISVDTGDNSLVSTGDNNLIIKDVKHINELNIDQINMAKPESEEPIIYYQDEISMKLPIKLKAIDHIGKISSVLGVISSVITIVGIFLDVRNFYPPIFVILAVIFIYSALYLGNMERTLKKDGKMNLGNRGKKIILRDNELLMTEKVGECLICHNKVYLHYDNSIHKLIGKCSNYKGHIYSFDPTVNVGVPMEIQKFYFTK